jgi:hypothetical protein
MDNPFEQMREHGSEGSQEAEATTQTSPDVKTAKDVFNTDWTKDLDKGAQEPTIYELEKLSKFKYQGQEMTPKDLEAAILRQKDYTQKTQSLSKEREAWQTERQQEEKFYSNLYYDLNNVKNNPELASEFIKVYPEKFHSYLKQVLGQDQQAQASQNQAQKPQYDVEMMSRMQKLETFYHEQEVAKNTQAINSTIDAMSKKYPDAIAEMAIGRVYEAHNRGEQVTPETWETAFKTVDAQMKDYVKAKYGDLVKKQTEVNKKSRDVDSGGGTIGRAPQKFKNLGEVTSHAINDLTKRG